MFLVPDGSSGSSIMFIFSSQHPNMQIYLAITAICQVTEMSEMESIWNVNHITPANAIQSNSILNAIGGMNTFQLSAFAAFLIRNNNITIGPYEDVLGWVSRDRIVWGEATQCAHDAIMDINRTIRGDGLACSQLFSFLPNLSILWSRIPERAYQSRVSSRALNASLYTITMARLQW